MKVTYCKGCRCFVRKWDKVPQKNKDGQIIEVYHPYSYCEKHKKRVLNVLSCKRVEKASRNATFNCKGCIWRDCSKYTSCYSCPNYNGKCNCVAVPEDGEKECKYYNESK